MAINTKYIPVLTQKEIEKNFLYKDLPYHGIFSASTNIPLEGPEALKNALKLYLMSNIGDYGRDINKGGVLIDTIGKPLTEEYRQMIISNIMEAMKDFQMLEVVNIDVTPDYMEKKWVITITFLDHYNKFKDTTTIESKAS